MYFLHNVCGLSHVNISHFFRLSNRASNDVQLYQFPAAVINLPQTQLLIFSIIFVGVQLIYNVLLVPGVQKSESVIYIYICIYPLFFRFFPHIDHYRVLSSLCYTVCPYQLFYIQQCVYINPNLPICPFPLFLLETMFVFYICDSVL